MPEPPPTVPEPPTRVPIAGRDFTAPQVWRQWFELMFLRVGGATGKPIIGDVAVFETTVGQAAMASGGTVKLLDALAAERWKVRNLWLSGAGTNFSGGGGDRLLSISDGTAIYSVVPAATLQALSAARWGDTGVPFPATAADFTLASAAGIDITAAYSGGVTDYTAGSLTIVIVAERTA